MMYDSASVNRQISRDIGMRRIYYSIIKHKIHVALHAGVEWERICFNNKFQIRALLLSSY